MQPIPNKDIVRFFKGLQLAVSLKKGMPDYAKIFQLGVVDGTLVGVSSDFVRLCKCTIPNILPTSANIPFDSFNGKVLSPLLRTLSTSGETIIDFNVKHASPPDIGKFISDVTFPIKFVLDGYMIVELRVNDELIKYPDWQGRVRDCKVLNSFNTTVREIENQLYEVDTEFVKMNGSLYDTKLIKDGLNFMGDVSCTIMCLDMIARFQYEEPKRVQGVSFKTADFSYWPAPCDYKLDGKKTIKKATIREFYNFDFGRVQKGD